MQKCTKSINRIVLPKKILVASPKRKKKRNAPCRNCAKRGSDIEKNLQTTKGAKVNNLITEMNEGMIETIAKNKASSIMHI